MTYNKRKKNSRMYGAKTHGYGSMKKHRGAGNRGGRGKAGTGKRADQNKPSIWKDTKYFGKHGFVSPTHEDVHAINTSFLEQKFNTFLEKGLLKEESGKYVIDLSKINIQKLLAKGKITKPFVVKVKYATKGAVEKIEKAGGSVELTAKPKSADAGKKE